MKVGLGDLLVTQRAWPARKLLVIAPYRERRWAGSRPKVEDEPRFDLGPSLKLPTVRQAAYRAKVWSPPPGWRCQTSKCRTSRFSSNSLQFPSCVPVQPHHSTLSSSPSTLL